MHKTQRHPNPRKEFAVIGLMVTIYLDVALAVFTIRFVKNYKRFQKKEEGQFLTELEKEGNLTVAEILRKNPSFFSLFFILGSFVEAALVGVTWPIQLHKRIF